MRLRTIWPLHRDDATDHSAKNVGRGSEPRTLRGVRWFAVSLVLVCLMPSSESLWIDEGYTARHASDTTLKEFAERIRNERGSEALMPLGMFAAWCGAKVFGRSELGLRMVSAVWIAAAIFILWWAGETLAIPWLPAFFACHPFVWFYAGEARPYAMMIAMGSVLLLAFIAVLTCSTDHREGFYWLLLSGLLLCATHLLGVVPFGVVVSVVAVVLLRRGWRPRARDWGTLVGFSGLFGLLGLYYLSALYGGAETGWAGPWSVGFGNVGYAVFEILGFAGFAPGKNELRQLILEGGIDRALSAFTILNAIGALLLLALYFLAALRFLKHLKRRQSTSEVKVAVLAALVSFVSLAIVFLLSSTVGFSFWGRHLAPVVPFVIMVLAIMVHEPTTKDRASWDVLALLLAVAWLASSLTIRFQPNHARDDYRSAARLARSAAQTGEVVWWVAAPESAEYYQVTFCGDDDGGDGSCVWYASKMGAEDLVALPPPHMALISKPEVFDRTGAVRDYLSRHGFQETRQFTAFVVFEAH